MVYRHTFPQIYTQIEIITKLNYSSYRSSKKIKSVTLTGVTGSL